MVERLKGLGSRRQERGGANTTGKVTTEKSTLARVAETYRARSPRIPYPSGIEQWGARRSGGVRAATSGSMTLVSREALDHRLMASTASGVAFGPGFPPHADTRLRRSALNNGEAGPTPKA